VIVLGRHRGGPVGSFAQRRSVPSPGRGGGSPTEGGALATTDARRACSRPPFQVQAGYALATMKNQARRRVRSGFRPVGAARRSPGQAAHSVAPEQGTGLDGALGARGLPPRRHGQAGIPIPNRRVAPRGGGGAAPATPPSGRRAAVRAQKAPGRLHRSTVGGGDADRRRGARRRRRRRRPGGRRRQRRKGERDACGPRRATTREGQRRRWRAHGWR
jgi:hypothetical protein